MLWANGSMRDSIIENGFRYFRFNVNQESDGYTLVFDWDEALVWKLDMENIFKK